MRDESKKLIAAVLSASVIFSMTGCAFLDKSKDEVLDVAESYAKNLAAMNISKLVKSTVKDLKDDQDTWEEKLTFEEGDLYTQDAAIALASISDTIAYEIDEESVEASNKDGEGSVKVTFTMADYEALLEDEDLAKIEDFVDAVGDADSTEIEITLEFEKDDDTWLCSNYEDVFEDLYAFTDEEYVFRIPFTESVLGVNWYGCDWDIGDGYYTNTTYIEVDLDVDWASAPDYSDIYYVVEYNGQEIYRETGTYMGYLRDYYDGAPIDDESGFLAAGTYTITFYDYDDSEIWSGTATVTVEAVATPTPTATPTPSDSGDALAVIVPGIVNYEVDLDTGDEIHDAVDQDTSGWYTSDGTHLSGGYYSSDSTEITFNLYTDSDLGTLEYRYMYTETSVVTADEQIIDLGFQTTTAESTDDGGYVYHLTISGDDVTSGYFILGVYDPRGTGDMVFIGFAAVL